MKLSELYEHYDLPIPRWFSDFMARSSSKIIIGTNSAFDVLLLHGLFGLSV